MTATVISEGLHGGAFIVSEAEQGYFSREQVTVALSQTLAAGQVLGAVDVPASVTSSAAADASNTGNGTFTLDATNPTDTGAQDGNYRVVAISAGASAVFEVIDPKGVEIGRVTTGGAAFASQIKFTIGAGGTAFAVGDAFTVTVGVESGNDRQVKAWTPTATDGSQNPVGILIYPKTTDGSNTTQGSMIARHAEVRLADLTFGGSPSAAQKAECIEQLRRIGIVCR